MKYLRLLSLAVAAMFTAMAATAQTTLPSKVEVGQPKTFTGEKIYKSKLKAGTNERTSVSQAKGYWNAISDRCDNTTYSGPSSSSNKYSSLDFNEQVRIAQIENGYALVYQDSGDARFPEITKNAKVRGWVPLSNLLLWSRCPVDDYGIFDKAMTVVNLDELDATSAAEKLGEKNMLRLNPNDKNKTQPVSSQQIFFVMKEITASDGSQRLLLSSGSKLEGINTQLLAGWADAAVCSRWTQRSCLERNWETRKLRNNLKGETVTIYDNPDMKVNKAQPWRWTFQEDDKRDAGQMLRFPILNNDTNNDKVYKVTVFGAVGDARLASAAKQEAMGRAEKKTNAFKNINIILVIDGTSSMEKYYAPVKTAIQKSIKDDLKDFNVKVGAVIYRDKVDGEYAVEYCPMMSADDPRLNEFLTKGGKYGIKSSPQDKTAEEDMYTGLMTALDWRKMGYSPTENNVMLLVGDCGNQRDDETAMHPKVVKGLSDNNMQLLVFQTYAGGEGAYGYFRMQANKMLKDNVEGQYRSLNSSRELGKLKELPDHTGRQYVHPEGTEQKFFLAAIRYPASNGPAAPEIIGQLILNNINEFSGTAENKYEAMLQYMAGIGGIETQKTTQGSMSEDFVKSILGERDFQLIKQINATLAVTGYAPKYSNDGTDFWKPVIFISESELASLMGDLKGVYNASVSENRADRSGYVDALISVVRTMIPDDVKKDPNGSMSITLNEITSMISGLNVQTEATGNKDRSLADLMDSKVVDDEEFSDILYRFKSKYEKLEGIRKGYEYTKDFGGVKYYWIAADDLP